MLRKMSMLLIQKLFNILCTLHHNIIIRKHISRLTQVVNTLFGVTFISAKKEQELQELWSLTGIPAPLTRKPLKRGCETWV